jgi:hypothetical protein
MISGGGATIPGLFGGYSVTGEPLYAVEAGFPGATRASDDSRKAPFLPGECEKRVTVD